MGSVLIDALSVDLSLNVVSTVGIGNFKSMHLTSFYHLLTSLVLWDSIAFPNSPHMDSYFKELRGDKLTEQLKSTFDLSSVKSPYVTFDTDEDKTEYLEARANGNFTDSVIERLQKRTIFYLNEDTSLYLYYPNPLRWDYLKLNAQNSNLNRESVLKRLEENIDNYSICSTVHFQRPLLIDFMREVAGDAPRELLAFALQLRDDKDVQAFRKSLDKFESLYVPGSINYEKMKNDEIDELANTAFNKYLSKKKGNLTIGISAGFGLINGSEIIPTGFSLDFSNIQIPFINHKNIIEKKFLYKLIDFALNRRK